MSLDLEQTYKNNMEFLKENLNELYNILQSVSIHEYELIETNGNLNVRVNGNTLYPDNVDAAIENQLASFLNNPPLLHKSFPTMERDQGQDYIHDKYALDIEKDSSYLKENLQFTNYHHNLDNYFPYLVVLGIGLGKHIELLVKNTDIKNLIIVDQDYCFLKISMHIIDWRPIIKHFNQDGYNISLNITGNPEVAPKKLINKFFRVNPYLQYYIPYYSHYNSNYFNAFIKTYADNAHIGFSGLGFYDDEIISIEHTVANINDNRKIYLRNNPLPKHSSVFIVGSGPSIDKDIENIKKYQKNAVIISCGTSLRILEENGIKPDYHFESERAKFQYDNLADNVSREFMKQIDFIGINVVYPGLLSLFKSAKIVFRNNDGGSSITTDDIPKLDHCNPTVVNAAFTFACDIGFKNIYLFGADMGFLEEGSHHSKYSAYYDEKSRVSKIKLHDTITGKKYPGNFTNDEVFLSNKVLLWCKQRLENSIIDYKEKKKKQINIFNCSDGIRILKTTPFHSKNIHLDLNIEKSDILNAVELNFSQETEKLHEILKKNLEKEKNAYCDKVDTLIEMIEKEPITDYKQMVELMNSTFYIASDLESIINHKENSSFRRSNLRGSIYHFYGTIFTHSLATQSKELSFQYINDSFKKVIDFLKFTKKNLEGINID